MVIIEKIKENKWRSIRKKEKITNIVNKTIEDWKTKINLKKVRYLTKRCKEKLKEIKLTIKKIKNKQLTKSNFKLIKVVSKKYKYQ